MCPFLHAFIPSFLHPFIPSFLLCFIHSFSSRLLPLLHPRFPPTRYGDIPVWEDHPNPTGFWDRTYANMLRYTNDAACALHVVHVACVVCVCVCVLCVVYGLVCSV